MARTVRDENLQTRTARGKLSARKKPYWRSIDQGRHIGYYRGERSGTWIARRFVGKGRYEEKRLGVADDTQDPNGADVLSFAQAQDAARAWFTGQALPARRDGPITVAEACESYVAFLKAARKSGDDSERRINRLIVPKFEGKKVADLTKTEIERWLFALVSRDEDDPEVERRSKDTANRVLTMFKAALNRAFADEANGLASDKAWRTVKPFKDVGRAREVHLDIAQLKRLANTCQGALRNLVTAAMHTGARAPGELVQLRVKHFAAGTRSLDLPDGKTGGRTVTLTPEGVAFFKAITAGRAPDDLLLPNDDGSAWGQNQHLRPMRKAVERAKLPKGTSLYSVRHSYASQAILAGMNLKLLAENMGTSIRMLEDHYAKFIASSRAKLIADAAPTFGLKLPMSSVVGM